MVIYREERRTVLLLAVSALAAGCSSSGGAAADAQALVDTSATQGDGALPKRDGGGDPNLARNVQSSTCGGFDRARALTPDARPARHDAGVATSYCDAELLRWSYDRARQRLTLVDQRMSLNCCGVHTVEAVPRAAGKLRITITDTPEKVPGTSDYARCRCTCVFDLTFQIDDVAPNPVTVSLIRTVLEWDPNAKGLLPASSTTLFDGTLDLGKGAGSEVLDGNPVPIGLCTRAGK